MIVLMHSDINGTYTSISNITLDSYDLTTSGTADRFGDVGGSSVAQHKIDCLMYYNAKLVTLYTAQTSLTSTLRTTTGKSIHGSETAFSLQNKQAAEILF